MTQLMLFDAPASVSLATPVAAAPSTKTATDQNERFSDRPSSSRIDEARRRPRQRTGEASQRTGEEGGVQRMGDLARLVLMRYEMVHRRRAALAQRQARCAG